MLAILLRTILMRQSPDCLYTRSKLMYQLLPLPRKNSPRSPSLLPHLLQLCRGQRVLLRGR